MEPDRFDDVGFEILETPDEPRQRRRPARRTVAAVFAGVLSVGALAAGAALALTPSEATTPARSHFVDERYPARGESVGRDDFARDGFSSGRHHDCPFKSRQRESTSAPEL